MARASRDESVRLDSPKGLRTPFAPRIGRNSDQMGRFSEAFARGMGTPVFLFGMTIFVVVWIAGPAARRAQSRRYRVPGPRGGRPEARDQGRGDQGLHPCRASVAPRGA